MRGWVLVGLVGCAGVEDEPTPFAAEVLFTVRNISDAGTWERSDGTAVDVVLAPGVFAVTADPDALLFEGQAASPALELLAETGDGSLLLAELEDDAGVAWAGLLGDENNPTYADDPILPGGSATAPLAIEEGLSLVVWMMLGPSNDTFLGTPPGGVALTALEGSGAALAWWDAGTEVNEPIGEGASQVSVAPGTEAGEVEGGTVQRVTAGLPDAGDVAEVVVAPR
jgi:hypothetical protein